MVSEPQGGINIFTTPGGGTPLRYFKGILKEYPKAVAKEATKDDGTKRPYQVIQFDFTDLDLNTIESIEPWLFPIASLQIGYSNTTETAWGRLMQSFRRLVPDAIDLGALVGKVQEWRQVPVMIRTMNQETRKFEDAEVPCWQILSIAGVTKVDITSHLIDLANGKTEAEFNEAAMQDPAVTAQPDIVTSITDRKLLPVLIDAGKLTKDADGVLHKAS